MLFLLITVIASVPMFAGEGETGREGDAANGPSVRGVVSDISGTTIKLLNGLVTIDAATATVVGEQNNTPLTLAAIKAGTVISATGVNVAGAPLHATTIEVHGPRSDGQLQGAIESSSSGQFSLLGQTITIDSSTMFSANGSVPFTASNLTPGTIVDVEVVVFQGKLVATRISPDQQGDFNSEN